MLAQNFMTAEQLRIPEEWRAALIKTLTLLETGKLKHVRNQTLLSDDQPRFSGSFNMNSWCGAHPECGTVACIGGTAELISGVKFVSKEMPKDLYNLFYPAYDLDWSGITPAQAATALRSYLTTGKAKWREALA